jgi:hypothetical protein
MLRDRVFRRSGRRSRGLGRVHRPAVHQWFVIGPRLGGFKERAVLTVHVRSGAVSSCWVDGGNWSIGGAPSGDPSSTGRLPKSYEQYKFAPRFVTAGNYFPREAIPPAGARAACWLASPGAP